MVCPFCLYDKTEVYNTRHTKKLNSVWRRRRCLRCERQFTTEEHAKPQTIIKIGITGMARSLPYSRVKLLLSLYKACDHRKHADEASEYLLITIEQKLFALATRQKQIIAKQDIVAAALQTLKNYDTAAYVKYLTYHQPGLDGAMIKKQLKQHGAQ